MKLFLLFFFCRDLFAGKKNLNFEAVTAGSPDLDQRVYFRFNLISQRR